MNVDTKTKAMLKFGILKTLCVDGRSKKQFKLSHYRYICQTWDYVHISVQLKFLHFVCTVKMFI